MNTNRIIVDVPDTCEVPAILRNPHYRHVPLSRERKNMLDRIITGNKTGTLSIEEERELISRLTKQELDVLIFGFERNGEYYVSDDQYVEQEWINALETN